MIKTDAPGKLLLTGRFFVSFYIHSGSLTHNTRMIKKEYPASDVKNTEDKEILIKEVRRDG